MPTLQEIFGNLEYHEMELKRYFKNDEEKRRKGLALKATTSIEYEYDDSKNLEETNDDDDESDLLTKKYQNFKSQKKLWKKKRQQQKNKKQK